MRALILAAERSDRLGTLCEQRPSCLIPLNQKPLLHYQTETLRQAGAEELALVAGYQAHRLKGRSDRLFLNDRWADSGSVRSLLCSSVWFGTRPVIVSYGDVFYSAETISELAESDADIGVVYDPDWLALWRARYDDPLHEAECFSLNAQNEITDIGGPATDLDRIKGQFTGLLRISEKGWWTILKVLTGFSDQQIDRMDTTQLLKQVIAAGATATGIANRGQWGEIIVPTDLPICEQRLAS